MEPILEVSGLTKAFEDRDKKIFYAVDHISFQTMPGQTLGIVGESGSGKSTLAKLLCCLEEPTEGQIRLCGQETETGNVPEYSDGFSGPGQLL